MKKPYHCSMTNQVLDKDQVMRCYVRPLKGLVSKAWFSYDRPDRPHRPSRFKLRLVLI